MTVLLAEQGNTLPKGPSTALRGGACSCPPRLLQREAAETRTHTLGMKGSEAETRRRERYVRLRGP